MRRLITILLILTNLSLIQAEFEWTQVHSSTGNCVADVIASQYDQTFWFNQKGVGIYQYDHGGIYQLSSPKTDITWIAVDTVGQMWGYWYFSTGSHEQSMYLYVNGNWQLKNNRAAISDFAPHLDGSLYAISGVNVGYICKYSQSESKFYKNFTIESADRLVITADYTFWQVNWSGQLMTFDKGKNAWKIFTNFYIVYDVATGNDNSIFVTAKVSSTDVASVFKYNCETQGFDSMGPNPFDGDAFAIAAMDSNQIMLSNNIWGSTSATALACRAKPTKNLVYVGFYNPTAFIAD